MRFSVLLLTVTGILGAVQPDTYEHALRLYERTEYKAAIAVLKDAPAGSESFESPELLGRCYLMDGQYQKASEIFEKAAVSDPNNSMAALWLGRAYGRRAETSFALAAIGWATKAKQEFERAVRLDPKNADAVDDLFDFYLAAPGFIGGGLDKARGLIPTIAKRDPAEAEFDFARVAQQEKNYPAAEAHLRKATELAPHQVGRVVDLAKFLSGQGRFEESEQAFDRAADMAPGSPRLLFARAETYVKTRRNSDQARTLLNEYLASANLTPDDPPRAEAIRLLKELAHNGLAPRGGCGKVSELSAPRSAACALLNKTGGI